MGRRRPKKKTVQNSLSDLSLQIAAGTTGGSYLSSYNTQAFSNNYALITLNRIILTYMYTGNGIFQTAIQLPVQDAIGKGIEIESGEMDNSDIDAVLDFWEEEEIWNVILNAASWTRLFGGGAVLFNSQQDPEKPLNFKNLHKTPIEFYDLDRWQFDTNIAIFDDWDSYISAGDNKGIIHLYGEPIHESRFLRMQGKRAPHYVRRQLRGWGMSEGERMLRDLNLYMKTQDVSFEIIDESKIDVYKINGLANKLLTAGGTSAITNRIQAANEIKNYVSALVLDANEDFEQKSMSFTGLAEIMQQNRLGVAAALRMPMTKLFGLSASGFNTGESDLENYNAMVESEVRAQLKPIIRKMLKITMAHLFGYVPEFSFKFPSLRELTPQVEQEVKNSEFNRMTGLYDRGVIDSEEYMQSLRKAGIVQIETKAEQGLNPNPEPPNGPEGIDVGSGVPGASGFENSIKKNSLTYSGHKLQGRTKFQNLDISIEQKKGSTREGIDADGNPWKTKFKYPYGYIRGTVGVDKDHVDCYLGPEKDADLAFIIAQHVPETGKYDEDKVMLGFKTKEDAKKAYEEHYNKPGFFGSMKAVPMKKLKKLMEKRKGKKL